ncbi:MAG: hypothetical protein A4E62_03068 [Syntrophorhabdus sp. PtaU1.Bin002]|nr:MAG: hypothetical protein A4E62_03068 [Syntrophorhabdus sp. PtaU1.Bin002]
MLKAQSRYPNSTDLRKRDPSVPIDDNIELPFHVAPDIHPHLITGSDDIVRPDRYLVCRGKGRWWLPEKVIAKLTDIGRHRPGDLAGNKKFEF